MSISINQEQRLFVIPSGAGYSCFGFDNCFQEARALAKIMGLADQMPAKAEIGTLKQYEQHRSLLGQFSGHPGSRLTWFNPETPEAVRVVLERARLQHSRLRLFFGDTNTGRDWLNEYGVVGTIGRSMGITKIPLLISNSRSSGGLAVLDSSIVRIIDCVSRRELYRHPLYHVPAFVMSPSDIAGYETAVLVEETTHARFKTRASAERWIAFMKGERMSK
jgi:hypothetical protein